MSSQQGSLGEANDHHHPHQPRFDEDISGAMKAAARGPIFITEGGQPSHVLLTSNDYRRPTDGKMSLAEALAQPGADFDFDPLRVGISVNSQTRLD